MVSRDTNLSSSRSRAGGRKRRNTRPLDEVSLRDLALHYAARYATTGAKLETYLARKIRERGVAEDDEGRVRELDVSGLVTRLIELGYVDDDAYARMRSRDLTARGYGKRRVEQALRAAGVEEQVREAHRPGETESRRAAMLYARKRRFGPFGNRIDRDASADVRHAAKEKQIAAMLRAGHDFDHVRFIVDAAETVDIEEWLAQAQEDDVEGRREGGL
ncbi:MAG: RecX family transcriptional regulator [Erythrobacter sp.]|nr:RecX family transcriptional regulator [Erythrobacter sp.]